MTESKRFPSGARVLVDGRDEAIVRQAWPEGSTSYAFAHYTVDLVGGDRNVAVAWTRVGVARKVWLDDVTEADEQATDKATALKILAHTVSTGESPATIDMFERAAWGAGATVEETENVIRQSQKKVSL